MSAKKTKTKKIKESKKTNTIKLNTTAQNEKRFTKLVDSIIKENEQDEFEIKKYRKNKVAYALAILSVIVILLLVILIICAIVYGWAR
ncbi:hypothetical protein [Mycoplasmopsis verecunda]|uniref:Uncharacterized protein n=1 Tax=Mycoplasmopsis verecunda TaxID=171291 RepID=A0A1T4KG38_9BACT|nr:hypothetical protein [Mycoplasmopsis verecunda]WPB54898.1 hypothetical protein SAM46_01940 [Mycoplasmopsis verecunda]SJZ41327.1 hypothetical protein SAMN02745154_00046 [Mycoplasmopsis verecunda]